MNLKMKKKVALISGVTGQVGAYLSELLLSKNYEVHGIKRRSSLINTKRIDHLFSELFDQKNDFYLHHGDLTDTTNLLGILKDTKPDEIYNLAAQSHVQVSFELPEYTANADAIGTLRILECIKNLELYKTKFYQASTSELFGKVVETPQTEKTHSIREVRMELQNFMHIGSQKIIVKLTTCLLRTVYSLIMSLL